MKSLAQKTKNLCNNVVTRTFMIAELQLLLQNRTGRQNDKSARGDETAHRRVILRKTFISCSRETEVIIMGMVVLLCIAKKERSG